MNEIIRQLCELRSYRADDSVPGKYIASDGGSVFFYFTSILTQEFVNLIISDDIHLSIILCDKQKKLKVPLEILPNIEVHNITTVRRQLIPNKFCPRFARLEGLELDQMKKHFEKLPLLLTSDPMAKIYDFRAGDIVKIYRLNGSLYFRRVVNPS